MHSHHQTHQSCVGAAGNSARVGGAALYAHVWPNLMLNRYGPWCDINIVYPVSARKCEIVFDYFLAVSCIQEKIEHGKRDHAALEQCVDLSVCVYIHGWRAAIHPMGPDPSTHMYADRCSPS